MGIRIPDDISLIGFDNAELSSIVHPPLTTVPALYSLVSGERGQVTPSPGLLVQGQQFFGR